MSRNRYKDKNWINIAVLIAAAGLAIYYLTPNKENREQSIEVIFEGNIEAGLTYAMKVDYFPDKKDISSCTDWSLFGGEVVSTKSMIYDAKINGEQHSLTLPINELKPDKCNWTPSSIELCVINSISHARNCNQILHIGRPHELSAKLSSIHDYEIEGIPLEIRCRLIDDSRIEQCEQISRLSKHKKEQDVSQLILFPSAFRGVAHHNRYNKTFTMNISIKPNQTNFVPEAGPESDSSRFGFPNYQAFDNSQIDRLAGAARDERDAFCKEYCASELSWSADDFTKSSIDDFYQTPEKIDIRCDFNETSVDIGGSERHQGQWINSQCEIRGLQNCYWSINYAELFKGRVACVRPVFASD